LTKADFRKFKRSGTERCPICQEKRRLVCHHINGRKIARWNESFNTIWCCASCHDEIHSGDVLIEFWVKTSAGRELIWSRRCDKIEPDIVIDERSKDKTKQQGETK